MTHDLTTSAIERQNVLNNNMAIPRIQKILDVEAYHFEGKYYLTKQMVADYYQVDTRTIERYTENNKEELERNGYFLCKGKRLKDFKLQFGPDKNVGAKTTFIALFDFRAFLNIGMLLAESEKAKHVRSTILDIVISTINEKAGGGTKYINWRDKGFLPAAIQEDNYHKNLTSAIFLIKNRKGWAGFHFLPMMEAYIWHVAAGNIGKDLLQRLIHSVINGEELDESTKLEVIHAMEKSPLYSEENEQCSL